MLRNKEFPVIDIDDDFVLREQKYSDAENFFKYFSDPTVSKYILSSIPKTLEEAQDEIIYWIDLFYKNTGIYWAIAEKSTNKLVGAIGYHDLNPFNNRAEISYDLAKEYWGKGLMSKATQKVLDYAFNELGLNRIHASTIEENVASIKLLENNGFQKEGILRNYRRHNGKYYDIWMYSILKNDER